MVQTLTQYEENNSAGELKEIGKGATVSFIADIITFQCEQVANRSGPLLHLQRIVQDNRLQGRRLLGMLCICALPSKFQSHELLSGEILRVRVADVITKVSFY